MAFTQTAHSLVPVNPNNLMSIEQIDWGARQPPPVEDMTPANPNFPKPRYTSMTDWAGGDFGNDVDVASATVALADASGRAPQADFMPRTQADKAAQLGVEMADDVGKDYGVFSGERTRTGTIEPWMPYPTAAPPGPSAPAIANIAPTSATEGDADTLLTVNGSDFTDTSVVVFEGNDIPPSFVSANQLTATIPATALDTAGMFSVVVRNGAQTSNSVAFTVNAP